MCVLLLSVAPDQIVVAANRDEFHERPTKALARWEDHPGIIGGRDLVAGGTWLAANDRRRFAAVTNYRDGKRVPNSRSRGKLVVEALITPYSPLQYLQSVAAEAEYYTGFNLIVGEPGSVAWFSNRSGEPPRELGSGIYGLSNALLDTPWPKVDQGKRNFAKCLATGASNERLFFLLDDRGIAADGDLPSTGVALEQERMLSALFVVSRAYGTRSSSIVRIDGRGLTFSERSFTPSGNVGATIELSLPA